MSSSIPQCQGGPFNYITRTHSARSQSHENLCDQTTLATRQVQRKLIDLSIFDYIVPLHGDETFYPLPGSFWLWEYNKLFLFFYFFWRGMSSPWLISSFPFLVYIPLCLWNNRLTLKGRVIHKGAGLHRLLIQENMHKFQGDGRTNKTESNARLWWEHDFPIWLVFWTLKFLSTRIDKIKLL